MLNRLELIGNMGKDPETITAKSGAPFTKFSIAVNKQGAGRDDKPMWVHVTTFGKTAEFVSTYLKKGSMVFVEGPLEVSEYEGSDGKNHVNIGMIANRVLSLSKREGTESSNGNGALVGAGASKSKAVADEDIPF
jgi:single-strand DNA-binding protein